MTEWYENSEFWERLEPFLFNLIRSPKHTNEEVPGIIQILGLQKGQKVLDMGCGPGRITLPLADKGMQMTGVDITKKYLAELGRKANDAGHSIELIKKDMRFFSHDPAFNAAISIFSSFGYCSDPHHDQKVLKNVADSLLPKGKFLLDVMGREALKRHFREQNEFRAENGDYIVETCTIKSRWDWIENHWTIVQGQHQKTFTFGIRIYSGEELTQELMKAGFQKVKLFGNFDGSPYDKNAQRLIAVAEKN